MNKILVPKLYSLMFFKQKKLRFRKDYMFFYGEIKLKKNYEIKGVLPKLNYKIVFLEKP